MLAYLIHLILLNCLAEVDRSQLRKTRSAENVHPAPTIVIDPVSPGPPSSALVAMQFAAARGRPTPWSACPAPATPPPPLCSGDGRSLDIPSYAGLAGLDLFSQCSGKPVRDDGCHFNQIQTTADI